MQATVHILIAAGVVHCLALFTPGPDAILIIENALLRSRRHARLNAIGIASGLVPLVILAIVGMAAVITKSALTFNLVKLVGAAYLGWLAYVALRRPLVKPETQTNLAADQSAFGEGFMTELTNPKAFLFLVAVFSLVLPVGASLGLRAAVAVELVVLTALYYWFLASFASGRDLKQRLTKYDKQISWVVFGFFITFAAALLWSIK